MKDLKIYIFIASALLAIYLVAEYNKPKPINWAESYLNTDKIPYGTYILYHQLHDIFPGADVRPYKEPVYNVLTDNEIDHANYLIVCKNVNLIDDDYDKLVAFIKKGNDVFISAENFGTYFLSELKVETAAQFSLAKKTRGLRLVNKTLDTNRVYAIDDHMSDYYFTSIDTAKAIVLGKDAHNNVNFIKYNFGQGSLYLNANPLMFTNYSLLNADGAQYAATALSNLHTANALIWDEYYNIAHDAEESPMRVVLRNPALRMAYYITLLTLLVFVFYEVKHRQRIIPIIDPLKNSTVDFVNVVGQVYYEQRNNANIAQKKAAYFLEYLRTRYSLKTNILNEEFVETLSHKSGVDTGLIKGLLQQIMLARSGAPVNDSELIELNKSIEQFYNRSK